MYEDAAIGGGAELGFIVSFRIKDRGKLEVAPRKINDWSTSPLRYAIGRRWRERGKRCAAFQPPHHTPTNHPPFVAD